MKIPTPLIGCSVHRTAFDYQVRLLLCDHDPYQGYRVDAELVIETPFLLCDANGERHVLQPGVGAGLAPVLDLFQKKVKAVDVGPNGALHLTFDNGAELHVDPHPCDESWHLLGTGIDGILVGPGGETGWETTGTEHPQPDPTPGP